MFNRLMRHKNTKNSKGSALILTVVLTVLLSLVGVLFVMATRVDEISSLAMVQQKNLDMAVDAIVSDIADILVQDLYGDPNESEIGHLFAGVTLKSQPDAYPQYPGLENEPWDTPAVNGATGRRSDAWLAPIDPAINGIATPIPADDVYFWQYISDITPGRILETLGLDRNLAAQILPEYQDDILPVTDEDADNNGTPDVIQYPAQANKTIADADGDGVADSRWIQIPGIFGSKGEPVYAAIRITDNGGRLNLNTAFALTADSEGDYLSEIYLEEIMRSPDENTWNIIRARDENLASPTAADYYNDVVCKLYAPRLLSTGGIYDLFTLDDELEIRNRYFLTSPKIAYFEQFPVGYESFDYKRGQFEGGGGWKVRLKSVRLPFSDLENWKTHLNPRNFSDTSGAYVGTDAWKYDRRHICTFYSFDRNLRRRLIRDKDDPAKIDTEIETLLADANSLGLDSIKIANDAETRKQIFLLLYAFRAFYADQLYQDGLGGYTWDNAVIEGARKSAQVLANIIDYLDDGNPLTQGPFFNPAFDPLEGDGQLNPDPTYINEDLISVLYQEVVLGVENPLPDPAFDFGLDAADIFFGYEAQPFITEIYYQKFTNSGTEPPKYYVAVELSNPYQMDLQLDGWQLNGWDMSGSNFTVETASAYEQDPNDLGRLVLYYEDTSFFTGIPHRQELTGLKNLAQGVLELKRPNPAGTGYIVVDRKDVPAFLFSTEDELRCVKWQDENWGFVDAARYKEMLLANKTADADYTPGKSNNLRDSNFSGTVKHYTLFMANNNRFVQTYGDVANILQVNSTPAEPLTVMVSNSALDQIKFTISQIRSLMDYMNVRTENITVLPGRINVNTATKEVIRAAIPQPNPTWSPAVEELAANIAGGVYARTADMIAVPGFDQFMAFSDDLTGRMDLFSRVANKYTVRSDVFSADILVRLGRTGPQKRVIALFDRSNVTTAQDTPRIVAVHPVPDAR